MGWTFLAYHMIVTNICHFVCHISNIICFILKTMIILNVFLETNNIYTQLQKKTKQNKTKQTKWNCIGCLKHFILGDEAERQSNAGKFKYIVTVCSITFLCLKWKWLHVVEQYKRNKMDWYLHVEENLKSFVIFFWFSL